MKSASPDIINAVNALIDSHPLGNELRGYAHTADSLEEILISLAVSLKEPDVAPRSVFSLALLLVLIHWMQNGHAMTAGAFAKIVTASVMKEEMQQHRNKYHTTQ